MKKYSLVVVIALLISLLFVTPAVAEKSSSSFAIPFVSALEKTDAMAYIDVIGISELIYSDSANDYYVVEDSNFNYIVSISADTYGEMEQEQLYWLRDQDVDNPESYHLVGYLNEVNEELRDAVQSTYRLSDEEYDNIFWPFFLNESNQAKTADGVIQSILNNAIGMANAVPAEEDIPIEGVATSETIDYSAPPIVKMVQTGLNDAGYNCGTPDGDAGLNTVTAIKNFQQDHGLDPSGIIDSALINALIMDLGTPQQSEPEVAVEGESSFVPEIVDIGNGCSYAITDTVFYTSSSTWGNYYDAIVEIQNTGEKNLYLSGATFDIEDSNGHLVATDDWISTAPDVIEPGEKGYFYTNSSSLEDASTLDGLTLVPKLSIKKANGMPLVLSVEDISL